MPYPPSQRTALAAAATAPTRQHAACLPAATRSHQHCSTVTTGTNERQLTPHAAARACCIPVLSTAQRTPRHPGSCAAQPLASPHAVREVPRRPDSGHTQVLPGLLAAKASLRPGPGTYRVPAKAQSGNSARASSMLRFTLGVPSGPGSPIQKLITSVSLFSRRTCGAAVRMHHPHTSQPHTSQRCWNQTWLRFHDHTHTCMPHAGPQKQVERLRYTVACQCSCA